MNGVESICNTCNDTECKASGPSSIKGNVVKKCHNYTKQDTPQDNEYLVKAREEVNQSKTDHQLTISKFALQRAVKLYEKAIQQERDKVEKRWNDLIYFIKKANWLTHDDVERLINKIDELKDGE